MEERITFFRSFICLRKPSVTVNHPLAANIAKTHNSLLGGYKKLEP
jgi:hypothetical protein